MKTTMMVVMLLVAAVSFGQTPSAKATEVNKDSSKGLESSVGKIPPEKLKTDTIAVPVYQMNDTVKALVYYGDDGKVKYCRGFAVLQGFAVLGKDKKWQWTEKPRIVAALDERKRFIKDVLEVK